MYSAIEAAQSSVYLEMYIFLNDTFPSHNFYDLLGRKAEQGVNVKIIIDAFGSATAPYAELERLRSRGAEVIVFKEWFRRTHRKVLVVDEKVGFLGGVNIGQQYIHWLDLHVMVTGRVVEGLIGSFAKSYRKSGGKDARLIKRLTRSRLAGTKTWIYDHIPGAKKNLLGSYYRDHIRSAAETIQIISPYFIPNPSIVIELERALARGVKVEVILPEHSDPQVADLAHRIFVRALYPKGAEFFFTRSMMHAKALIIDGKEAVIGSQNLDGLSYNYNMETGVLFQRKDMIRDLQRIIVGWKREAFKFDPALDVPRWYDTLIGALVWLLQPVL